MNLDSYRKQLAKQNFKDMKEREKRIAKQYKTLTARVLKDVGELYEKYEKGGKLTYAEMLRFDRYSKFVSSMEHHVSTMTKDVSNELHDLLDNRYKYSFNWMAWAIQKVSRVKLQLSPLKLEQIRAAVNNPVKGLTLSATLEKARRDIIYTINQNVTRMLSNGATYKELAGEIRSIFEGDKSLGRKGAAQKAIRIARTEAHRVEEQATLDIARDANSQGVIMVKIWRNMKDSRVRRTSKANHVTLEGQTVPVEEMFDLGKGKRGIGCGSTGYAEHDINCRCFLAYEIERIAAARTDEDLANQTFDAFESALRG